MAGETGSLFAGWFRLVNSSSVQLPQRLVCPDRRPPCEEPLDSVIHTETGETHEQQGADCREDERDPFVWDGAGLQGQTCGVASSDDKEGGFSNIHGCPLFRGLLVRSSNTEVRCSR